MTSITAAAGPPFFSTFTLLLRPRISERKVTNEIQREKQHESNNKTNPVRYTAGKEKLKLNNGSIETKQI